MKVSAAQMLLAVNRTMNHLKSPVYVDKTGCLRCPEEPLERVVSFKFRLKDVSSNF